MLRVGIAALHGFPCHHFHIFLLVFPVEEGDGAKAGVRPREIHAAGFFRQKAPDHPLIFITGSGHLNGGGIARGKCLDGDVITHDLFLSQPFAGCFQKRQFAHRIQGA